MSKDDEMPPNEDQNDPPLDVYEEMMQPGTKPIPLREVGDDWRELLAYSKQGGLKRCPENVGVILVYDDEWQGVIGYNQFTNQFVCRRDFPKCAGLTVPKVGEELSDAHAVSVGWRLRQAPYVYDGGQETIKQGIAAAAHTMTFNPLREYLGGLSWDGLLRIDPHDRATTRTSKRPRTGFGAYYLGTDDTPYTRAVIRMFLVSCVARALRPGCQADHMLVLEGAQGSHKTSACRILAKDWFCPSLGDLRDEKQAAERLQGSWLCEIGELDAFRGAGATRVKDFISRTSDRYRAPWGRTALTRQRSCVFIGTTNESQYLRDPTGARRFWPVRVAQHGGIRRDELAADVDQVWAEAKELFESGVQWWPDSKVRGSIEQQQEERFEGDEWEQRISDWLEGREEVTLSSVLSEALGLEPGKWGQAEQNRAARVLIRLHYERKQRRGPGKTRPWYYQLAPVSPLRHQ